MPSLFKHDRADIANQRLNAASDQQEAPGEGRRHSVNTNTSSATDENGPPDEDLFHNHSTKPIGKKSLLCEIQPLSYKDIGAELRGYKDLDRFADNEKSVVVLDVRENTIDGIVSRILEEFKDLGLLGDGDGENDVIEEAKEALIREEAGRAGTGISGDIRELHSKEDTVGKHWKSIVQGPGFVIPFGRTRVLDEGEERVVGIARLATPTNLGTVDDSLTQFVVVVLGPLKEIKGVKAPLELSRTFASLFQDDDFFNDAVDAQSPLAMKEAIRSYLTRHSSDGSAFDMEGGSREHGENAHGDFYRTGRFAGGLIDDIKRKYKWSVYRSDWTDGIREGRTLLKYLSTIVWLYFAIIMPTIAFGALNDKNTTLPGNERGQIGVIETLLAQSLSGLVFAAFSGQPLVIVMTTGPLTVFIEVLFSWSSSLDIEFLPFYAWTGLWTAAVLIVLVLTDASAFIRYCGNFTEEIFATLIAAIFIGEFIKPLIHVAEDEPTDVFLLSFLLAVGTYLVAHWLLVFRRSFLLKPIIRTLLSDFGVPIAIIAMSALRRAFTSIPLEMLRVPDEIGLVTSSGRSWVVPLFDIKVQHIFLAAVSGLLLATLFFLDQNISSVLVNKPENKLKKGVGYHLDLAVVAILVAVTSIFGMTWTHAALPHSPLHARALADVHEYEEHGRTYERVVRARETRITAFVTHILIALSILAKDVIGEIPMAVLYGFFLYIGVATLENNPLWDRILLWFTQKEKYPPNHYVRRVSVKRIHLYTTIQVALLVILWFIKSNFYMGDTVFNTGLLFPFIIALFIVVRMFILPKIFRKKELIALESNE